MEKTLLRRKTVLENGVIIKKWYCTKRIKKDNPTLDAVVGWNIQKEGECAPACAPATLTYYEECIGGDCVRIYY